MADMDGMRYARRTQLVKSSFPGHWPAPMAPTCGKDHGFREEVPDDHHAKKSAIVKLKEKAKKWKHILVRKKRGHEEDEGERIDADKEGNIQEQHPEYHGASMYESETASSPFKQVLHQGPIRHPSMHKKSTPCHPYVPDRELEMKYAFDSQKKPELHHLNVFKKSTQDTLSANQGAGSNKPLSEIVLEILAPVCTVAKEVMLEKGASVKEYVKNMLQPGEEERALSQLITETISQDHEAGEVGVLEKIKEVISLLMRREELNRTIHSGLEQSSFSGNRRNKRNWTHA